MKKRTALVFHSLLTDSTVWSLLLANGVTIFFALREQWNLDALLWVYWFQNVIIGLFHFVRMLRVRHFFISDPKARLGTPNASRIALAAFFLLHYGVFQFVYLVFLLDGTLNGGGVVTWGSTAIAIALFFFNHAFSFFRNQAFFERRQNLLTLLFLPYARIIPMHLFAIIGGFLSALESARLPLLFFLVLKTIADIVGHGVQNALGNPAAQKRGLIRM